MYFPKYIILIAMMFVFISALQGCAPVLQVHWHSPSLLCEDYCYATVCTISRPRKSRKRLHSASSGRNLQQVSQRRALGDVEEFYTVSEAAKLLGVSGSRVRQLLTSGELEGEQDPLSDRWRVSRVSVHARREDGL